MAERDKNLVEFAKKTGIARTTLQGYLKEKSKPRAENVELLSKKLNISRSALISGPNVDVFDLEVAAKDELYPLLLSLLQQCQSLSAEIYRLPAKLSRQDMLEGGEQK